MKQSPRKGGICSLGLGTSAGVETDGPKQSSTPQPRVVCSPEFADHPVDFHFDWLVVWQCRSRGNKISNFSPNALVTDL